MRNRARWQLAIVAVFVGGVAIADAQQPDQPSQGSGSPSTNGSGMNGSGMNGSGMNGSGMNGSGANGTSANGSSSTGMMNAQATMKDIETTLGFVPQWLKSVPASMLPAFWMELKSFQMSSETKLDQKTKELIGLAVAAQIPCEYCVAFHTESARMNGATDQEIQEAVGMAALTREASTLLNGMQIDKTQFRRDLDRMIRKGKQQARK
jgi:AhpD family alkylhydroperoxidase